MEPARTVLALMLLTGCAGEPRVLEDCARLSGAAEREDCRLQLLEPLFEQGDADAFARGLGQLEEPRSRDLVRLRLAVAQPDRAGALCEEVETDAAREKCRQVLGRPHLRAPHRNRP